MAVHNTNATNANTNGTTGTATPNAAPNNPGANASQQNTGQNQYQANNQQQQAGTSAARDLMNAFGGGSFNAIESSPTMSAIVEALKTANQMNGMTFGAMTVDNYTYNMHYTMGVIVAHGVIDGEHETYIYSVILEASNSRPEKVEPQRDRYVYLNQQDYSIVPSPMDAWNASTYATVSSAVISAMGLPHDTKDRYAGCVTLFRDADDGSNFRAKSLLDLATFAIKAKLSYYHPSALPKFNTNNLGRQGCVRKAIFKHSETGGVLEDVVGAMTRADYVMDLVIEENGTNDASDFQNRSNVTLGSTGGFYDLRPLEDINSTEGDMVWVAHHVHTIVATSNQLGLTPEIAMTLLVASTLADENYGFLNFMLHRNAHQSQAGDYARIMEDQGFNPIVFDTSPQGIADAWGILREDICDDVVQVIRCPKAGQMSYITDMFVAVANCVDPTTDEYAIARANYINFIDGMTNNKFSQILAQDQDPTQPDDALFVFNSEVSLGRWKTSGADGMPSEIRPLDDIDTLYGCSHLFGTDEQMFWDFADSFVILPNVDPNQVLDRRRVIINDMVRGTMVEDGSATDVIMTPLNLMSVVKAFIASGVDIDVLGVPLIQASGRFANRHDAINTMQFATNTGGRTGMHRVVGNAGVGRVRRNPMF